MNYKREVLYIYTAIRHTRQEVQWSGNNDLTDLSLHQKCTTRQRQFRRCDFSLVHTT
jgi:hypothetical protein